MKALVYVSWRLTFAPDIVGVEHFHPRQLVPMVRSARRQAGRAIAWPFLQNSRQSHFVPPQYGLRPIPHFDSWQVGSHAPPKLTGPPSLVNAQRRPQISRLGSLPGSSSSGGQSEIPLVCPAIQLCSCMGFQPRGTHTPYHLVPQPKLLRSDAALSCCHQCIPFRQGGSAWCSWFHKPPVHGPTARLDFGEGGALPESKHLVASEVAREQAGGMPPHSGRPPLAPIGRMC